MGRLTDYRKSIYSQNCEDGVIAEIIRRLPAEVPRWNLEFGAWDWRYGSNCYALALEGWQGLMIEGDPLRFARLERTATRFANRMLPIRSWSSLESTLRKSSPQLPFPVTSGCSQ